MGAVAAPSGWHNWRLAAAGSPACGEVPCGPHACPPKGRGVRPRLTLACVLKQSGGGKGRELCVHICWLLENSSFGAFQMFWIVYICLVVFLVLYLFILPPNPSHSVRPWNFSCLFCRKHFFSPSPFILIFIPLIINKKECFLCLNLVGIFFSMKNVWWSNSYLFSSLLPQTDVIDIKEKYKINISIENAFHANAACNMWNCTAIQMWHR